jgi:predicted Fe-Mo cluster-binding NifX family protein
MKVCIPIKNNAGLDSEVYGHFGSAPCFFVYNTDENIFDIIDNQTVEHEHGKCNPLANFADNPIEVMVCCGIGLRALQKLNYAGVQVLKSDAGLNVKETLELLKESKLEILDSEDACTHNH